MGKTNINVVVDDELLERLQQNCRGNRNRYRSAVKRATPVSGVEVTVPEEKRMESDPHTMTDEELIAWFVHQLAKNRTNQF